MGVKKGANVSKALRQARAGTEAEAVRDGAVISATSGDAGGDAVAMAERLRTILEYRKMGASLQQIGQKFDLTAGRVHQIITQAIADLPKQAAEDVKALELERLDAMQFALWPDAQKGDIGAITTILSIMTRRARYLGLDVAEAVDPAGAAAAANNATDARNALLGRLLAIQERLNEAQAKQAVPALEAPSG